MDEKENAFISSIFLCLSLFPDVKSIHENTEKNFHKLF